MVENVEDKFSVFIPFEIEKAGEGEDRYANMRIKGIASSPHHGSDSDGETLEPSGMDLAALRSHGTLNFHHLWTKDPLAIIGEPTKAEITANNELYIEGKLYKSSQKARDVYDLGQILEHDSDTRRLGFSIEGTALVRDPKNKKRILKSKLTAVAITPSPKCKGTRMDIMKGGLEDVEFELIKGGDPLGDYLVDVIDESGIRRTVDKNFDVKVWNSQDDIQKAMAAGYVTGRDTTGQVLGQEPLKQESLDGKKKKKKSKAMTKGEIYMELFSTFHLSDPDLIKPLYSLVEEIQKGLTPDMADNSITKEAIDKAKSLLEGKVEDQVSTTTTDIKKGDDGVHTDLNTSAAPKTDAKKTSRENWDKLKLQFDSIKMSVEQYGTALSELLNYKYEDGTPASPASVQSTAGKDGDQALVAQRAIDSTTKAETTELVKAQVDELTKGFNEQIESLKKEIQNKETEKSDLKKSFDELNGKFDQILKSNPGPKSKMTATAVERFDFAPAKEGERTLSLSRNKKEVVAELVKAAGNDFSETNIFAQAASAVEIAGALGNDQRAASIVADSLRKKSGIIIIG